MVRFFYAFFFAILILSAAARAQEAVDSASVVAVVNGDLVTVTMLERELIRIHNVQKHDTSRSDFDIDRLVQKLINDRLLAQEARAIGLEEDSLVMARVEKFRTRLALEVMLREALPDTFAVTEQELADRYYQQYRRFQVRMVSVRDSLTSAAIRDSILSGVPIEQLSATHSIDRFKDKGGLATPFATRDMPEVLRDTLLHGQVGDLLGPVNLFRVFVLLRVEKHLPPDTVVTLDSARTALTQEISAEKRREAQRVFYEKLIADGEVRVDSAVVDSVLIRMSLGDPPSPRAVVTLAGGRRILEEELRNKYIHKSIGRVDNADKPVLYRVLQEQVENLLLQEAAARSQFFTHPTVTEPVRGYEDSLLVIAYLEEVVLPNVEIEEQEISKYYEANRESFRDRPRYKIMTLTRDLPEEAEEDLKALQSGADFAWLARQHSIDFARDRGGASDWLTYDKLPGAAVAMLDTMKNGDVTPVVETEEGFAIIKRVDVQEGAILPVERVAPSIRAHLMRVATLEEIDKTVQLLRRSAEIEIHDDVVRSMTITGRAE